MSNYIQFCSKTYLRFHPMPYYLPSCIFISSRKKHFLCYFNIFSTNVWNIKTNDSWLPFFLYRDLKSFHEYIHSKVITHGGEPLRYTRKCFIMGDNKLMPYQLRIEGEIHSKVLLYSAQETTTISLKQLTLTAFTTEQIVWQYNS